MNRLFRACCRCGFPVVREKHISLRYGVNKYPFYCPECDENMYSFETEEKAWVRIAKKGDYKKAYKDFCNFEKGFDEDVRVTMSYDDFVKELEKGYGESGCVQIARLFENEYGIFYDNNFAR